MRANLAVQRGRLRQVPVGGQVVLVHPGSGTVVVRLGTLGTGAAEGADAYTVADAARVLTEALTE